jgi:hypothetical protein
MKLHELNIALQSANEERAAQLAASMMAGGITFRGDPLIVKYSEAREHLQSMRPDLDLDLVEDFLGQQ